MDGECSIAIQPSFAQFIKSFIPEHDRSTRTDILLVTPYVSAAIEASIHELRQAGVHVDVLLIPELDEMKQSYRALMQQSGLASTHP